MAGAVHAAVRVFEFDVRLYRRTWRGGLLSTIVTPVFFLVSLGFGLGRFVDDSGSAGAVAGISYAAFLAPGLLAAQAMQTAGFSSTYPIMGRVVWDRIYSGMLSTPITIPGIVFGELAWIAARLMIATTAFLLVMVLFGLVASPSGVLAMPAAVLTGLAFAAPIMAFTPTQRNDQAFSAIFRFGITPMFLFSGTFFPIEQLPPLIQPIAWITPLYHGVALCRQLTLGIVEPVTVVIHLGVLAVYIAIGTAVALVTFRRTLVR
jgi:lipooligosaccharide transport system permease protein